MSHMRDDCEYFYICFLTGNGTFATMSTDYPFGPVFNEDTFAGIILASSKEVRKELILDAIARNKQEKFDDFNIGEDRQ